MVKISFSTFVFNIYRLLLKVFSRGDSFSHDEAEVLLSCVIDRCLYLFVNLIDIIREAQITETPLSIIEFSLTALPNYSFQSESKPSLRHFQLNNKTFTNGEFITGLLWWTALVLIQGTWKWIPMVTLLCVRGFLCRAFLMYLKIKCAHLPHMYKVNACTNEVIVLVKKKYFYAHACVYIHSSYKLL